MAGISREQCLNAKAIALSDTNVVNNIVTNLKGGWDLTGISCLKEGATPDQIVVLIATDMPPWAFMPASVVVTVSLSENKVLSMEPYIPDAG